MQHIKHIRPGRAPLRSRRVGADAAFAKAMARSEFGRFYTDEQEQREIRRSLARGKANRQILQPAKAKENAPPPKAAGKSKPVQWREPSPRHRRTELAEARARLKEAAKLRTESEEA